MLRIPAISSKTFMKFTRHVSPNASHVSGHFTYGVMALSAATFMFWNFFGTSIAPAAFNNGNHVSLALQLSCSVLVIACPCALGLSYTHCSAGIYYLRYTASV